MIFICDKIMIIMINFRTSISPVYMIQKTLLYKRPPILMNLFIRFFIFRIQVSGLIILMKNLFLLIFFLEEKLLLVSSNVTKMLTWAKL